MNRFIEGMISGVFGSWKTTICGFLAALCILIPELQAALDGNMDTVANMSQIMAALGMMGLGAAARDNGKTSEDVGAK
jgi:hypothetical protein